MTTSAATILIIDNNKNTRQITRHFVKNMKFDSILVSDNGRDAFKILQEERVDLVISDWDLPYLNGLELIRQMRQTPKLKAIPFVMIASLNNPAMIKQAVDAKVTELIIKPFTFEVFEEKVSKILPPG